MCEDYVIYSHATSPLDRIYGIREFLDPITRRVFFPDYTTTMKEALFLRVATYLLQFESWGGMYTRFPMLSDRLVPSWVPDFINPFPFDGPKGLQHDKLLGGRGNLLTSYCIYNEILSLQGVEVDFIEDVFDVSEVNIQ
jgi:hypothetical protein